MGNKQLTSKLDYDAVRNDIKEIMENPDWDDGSYAPLLIRFGWHSSGTYNASDNTGGSNGATMRYEKEMNDPENKGLTKAREILEPIKKKYPSLSYSDLWIIAAYVALEVTGGPIIKFEKGRQDKPEKLAIEPGRLPHAEEGLLAGLDSEGRINGWENLAQHIRDVFYRMGFNDNEIVALITGGHVYGRCHPEHSGYNGAWVETPTKFTNEYAADLFSDEWMYVEHDTKVNGELIPEETRPGPGKRQYMTKWEPAPKEAESAGIDIKSLGFEPGKYKVIVGWLNVRRNYGTDSYVVYEAQRNEEHNIVCMRRMGKGIRGQLDIGGWVSLVNTDGTETMYERIGEWDFYQPSSDNLPCKYRVDTNVLLSDIKLFTSPEISSVDTVVLTEREIEISEYISVNNNKQEEYVFGRVNSLISSLNNKYVLLLQKKPEDSMTEIGYEFPFERIVKGYNETPRKPTRRLQVKYQMMLPSDMVLLWDEGFRVHLKKYADDEELLKQDFGAAYKKLTELGCPFCPGSMGAKK